jgi:hypothetical protein
MILPIRDPKNARAHACHGVSLHDVAWSWIGSNGASGSEASFKDKCLESGQAGAAPQIVCRCFKQGRVSLPRGRTTACG